ncbi:MAG: ABC transporter ATP-binding protein/permease [Clostridiales bacterium]|nr:ABC transporter ATP-binding protein/permease [Clostridiales bacterium]
MKSFFSRLKRFFGRWDETKSSIKWMSRILKPFKKYVYIILSINIISLAISYASTIAGKYVVDFATSGQINPKYIAIMVSTSLVAIFIGIFTKMLGDYIGENFTFSIRADIYNCVQRTTWQNITRFHSGDIETRLTSDIASLSDTLIHLVPNIIVVFSQLAISFGILFYYDKPLALFALLLGPFGAAFSMIFRKKYKKYQTELRESESEYRSYMQESMSNIAVIKTFQQEDYSNQYINDIKKRRLSIVVANSRITSIMGALTKMIYSLGYVLAFCWGTYRMSKGDITYGTLTVFITLVSQVQGSVSSLVQIVPQSYNMLISAKRIREIADLEFEDYSDNRTEFDGVGLEINNVSFTYDTEKVLKDVNITVAPGEKIGVIGSSGAGKTTLIRLLLSLVKPDSGELYYYDNSGHKEKISTDSRRLITYVPQGNTLFSGTVEKNLLTGNQKATAEEMWNALEMADAADFVKKMPDGLKSKLTEHAGGLSEGQAQRIAIARALLRNKPVLIFDEATSALDENTESRVLERIVNDKEKTYFIITHRRSMLKYCDRVLEIDDDGKVSIRVSEVK